LPELDKKKRVNNSLGNFSKMPNYQTRQNSESPPDYTRFEKANIKQNRVSLSSIFQNKQSNENQISTQSILKRP